MKVSKVGQIRLSNAAVIPRVGAKLVQDHLLGLSPRLPITLINGLQILPSALVPQPGGLLFPNLVGLHLKWRDVLPFGYILDGAIRHVP
jgi:hypothetical protein